MGITGEHDVDPIGEYSVDPRRILRRSEGVLENMLGSYENTTNLIEGS